MDSEIKSIPFPTIISSFVGLHVHYIATKEPTKQSVKKRSACETEIKVNCKKTRDKLEKQRIK